MQGISIINVVLEIENKGKEKKNKYIKFMIPLHPRLGIREVWWLKPTNGKTILALLAKQLQVKSQLEVIDLMVNNPINPEEEKNTADKIF